jgi:hypothetical protein
VRRTMRAATALRWATAVAGVAITVSACGPLQLGAAAIYGNHRITTEKLAAEVASLNSAYQADKAKVHITYGPAAMPREILTWMLRFAARDQLAASHGIVVTPGESQRALAEVAASVQQGGSGTLATAAVAAGLPPDLLSGLGRYVATQSVLDNQLDHGVPPKTSAENQALEAVFVHLQCLAAKSLDIKVNPQYGAFDYSQDLVVPATSALAAAGPAVAAKPGTVVPQLTPAC